MIDDVRLGLALSDFYFAALQLLRLASDWIQAAQDDLNDLVSNLRREIDSLVLPGAEVHDFGAFHDTWDSVLARQQSLAKPLLARIARKQGELNSLKDGVRSLPAITLWLKCKMADQVRPPLSGDTLTALQRNVCQRSKQINPTQPLYSRLHRGYHLLSPTELRCGTSAPVMLQINAAVSRTAIAPYY
jgi:hypothetical protein